MLIRREALEDMNMFNPDFFMYSEEKDLALRLRKKSWVTYFVPSCEIIHYGGKSTERIPEDMFLELLRSQIKFFSIHYQGWYRKAILWTYWIFLCSSCLASLPFAIRSYGKHRLKLFLIAVSKYPNMVRQIH